MTAPSQIFNNVGQRTNATRSTCHSIIPRVRRYVFILFISFALLGCNRENKTHIWNNIFIEKDEADDVYIIVKQITEAEQIYVCVGDVQWVALYKNYIFGYKKGYKTTTFLETEDSFYFVIDVNQFESEDYSNKEFTDEVSMRKYLKSLGCVEPYTYLSFKK